MERIILVLDNIRSAYNVGAILRSAAAFGIKKVVYLGITPYPNVMTDRRLPHIADRAHKEIAKTALGAESKVHSAHFNGFADLLPARAPIVALEQSPDAVLLPGFKPNPPLILVIGNEVDGISKTVTEQADTILQIPHTTAKESLNVSAAASIALYDFYTKL